MRLQLWVENSPRKAWETRSESWNSVDNEKGLKGIPDAFLFLILEGSYGELGREERQFRKTIFSQFSSVSCQFHEGKGHMFCSLLHPQSPLQWLYRMGLLEMPISPSSLSSGHSVHFFDPPTDQATSFCLGYTGAGVPILAPSCQFMSRSSLVASHLVRIDAPTPMSQHSYHHYCFSHNIYYFLKLCCS